jgi:CheY-like chemotaxis protein
MPSETPPINPIGPLLLLWLLIRYGLMPLFRWLAYRRHKAARSDAIGRLTADTVERGRGLVLVADDERHIVRLVEISLQRAGYGAMTTTDWEEVLPMARAVRPDLVVVDILMPRRTPAAAWEGEPTGCELVRAMQADPSLAGIPVILLTYRSARSVDDSRCTDLPSDAATYLYKPFNPAELLSIVNDLIRPRNSSP